MRERAAVDEFEFAAERHAMRETRRAHARPARDLGEQMRGRLAFDGGVRRDDQLAYLAFGESGGEQVESEFLRPHAVERRQPAEQHEITTAEAGRLLDRELVDRRLDDTEQLRVALLRSRRSCRPRLR